MTCGSPNIAHGRPACYSGIVSGRKGLIPRLIMFAGKSGFLRENVVNLQKNRYRYPRILAPLDSLTMASVLRSLTPLYSLLRASIHFCRSFLTEHGVPEVLGGTIGIGVRIKTFEGTMACAGEVRLLLSCCYC